MGLISRVAKSIAPRLKSAAMWYYSCLVSSENVGSALGPMETDEQLTEPDDSAGESRSEECCSQTAEPNAQALQSTEVHTFATRK